MAGHTSLSPSWVHRVWNAPWLWIAIVVALFCVPLFVGLGDTDFENDESIYSFSVDVMVKTGDWLTPKNIPSETSAFLEKPPLQFWMVAAPIYLGWLPNNEFGQRFVAALLASFAFLYVLAIGRRLGGPVAGLVAVLFLFAQHHLIFQHGVRTNNMESSMLLAYCGGVYHFLAWRSVNPDAKWHIYAMAWWFVFGFMTKFVAILFLPMILVLAALLRHEDRVRVYRDWRTFALAAIGAVGLIAPWFIYQYIERGPRLFDIMFNAHVMKRFTAYLDPRHLHPWNYYFVEVWAEQARAGTQVLIVLGTLYLLLKTVRHRWSEGALIVLWFAVPLAVMSTTTSKLYHYAYPFLPPLCLAAGLLTSRIASVFARIFEEPFNAFARMRRRVGPWTEGTSLQIVATVIGVAALVVALVTYAFERIWLPIGSIVVRNSSVLRPAVISVVALLAGAPAAVLRGLVTAAILLLALPLAAYESTIARTREGAAPYSSARSCLLKIVADDAARGKTPPGVRVEAPDLSFVPFYYLRNLGPWQSREVPSETTVLMHLLVPGAYRPVLLSNQRYAEIMTKLVTERAPVLERTAVEAGVDVATLAASLDAALAGTMPMSGATLVLPGPYAVCAAERSRLGSR